MSSEFEDVLLNNSIVIDNVSSPWPFTSSLAQPPSMQL